MLLDQASEQDQQTINSAASQTDDNGNTLLGFLQQSHCAITMGPDRFNSMIRKLSESLAQASNPMRLCPSPAAADQTEHSPTTTACA